jgi:hypothetical protein
MEEPNLVLICAIAFVAVMVILGFEALVIRLITRLFPQHKPDLEAIAEVIQQAVVGRFPGAKVVSVEEVNPQKI